MATEQVAAQFWQISYDKSLTVARSHNYGETYYKN